MKAQVQRVAVEGCGDCGGSSVQASLYRMRFNDLLFGSQFRIG